MRPLPPPPPGCLNWPPCSVLAPTLLFLALSSEFCCSHFWPSQRLHLQQAMAMDASPPGELATAAVSGVCTQAATVRHVQPSQRVAVCCTEGMIAIGIGAAHQLQAAVSCNKKCSVLSMRRTLHQLQTKPRSVASSNSHSCHQCSRL